MSQAYMMLWGVLVLIFGLFPLVMGLIFKIPESVNVSWQNVRFLLVVGLVFLILPAIVIKISGMIAIVIVIALICSLFP